MRKIREALRLCLAEGLSPRQAGIATGLPRSTVRRYVIKATESGLSWPLPPELDDRDLEKRLYGRRKVDRLRQDRRHRGSPAQ
jgi:Homeodomain-like domain